MSIISLSSLTKMRTASTSLSLGQRRSSICADSTFAFGFASFTALISSARSLVSRPFAMRPLDTTPPTSPSRNWVWNSVSAAACVRLKPPGDRCASSKTTTKIRRAAASGGAPGRSAGEAVAAEPGSTLFQPFGPATRR